MLLSLYQVEQWEIWHQVHVLLKMLTPKFSHIQVIYMYERPCLSTFPNPENRVENIMCSGVFLMSFKVCESTVYGQTLGIKS